MPNKLLMILDIVGHKQKDCNAKTLTLERFVPL